MDPNEVVAGMAELGLGMAGFSGIAIALTYRPGRLTDLEAYRIVLVFSASFGAMFLALLPLVLLLLGAPATMQWSLTALFMAVFTVAFLAYFLGRARRFVRDVPELFSRTAVSAMTTGHVVNLLLQLAAAIGVFEPRTAGIVALGIAWILFHAAFQFGRILFIRPAALSGYVERRTAGELSQPPGA